MNLPVDIAAKYAAGSPFAVYRLPGTCEIRVADRENDFLVSPWLGRMADAVSVAGARPGRDTLLPWCDSTPYDAYIASTGKLIKRLAERGGKCVRMRGICRSSSRLDVNRAVADMFERFPAAFCHCYYTPATGLWMGATPEILLDYSHGHISTMALAGTRAAGSEEPWDMKNVREHAFVTDYILDVFARQGVEATALSPVSLRHGAVEHICTRISADAPMHFNLAEMIDALNPTPAVAGMPLNVALKEIEAIEDTPRRCYAGWVAVKTAGAVKMYVNLRCAHISPEGWCVYAGGGITAESDAEAEWRETEAKALPLLEILNRNTLSV